MKIVFATHLRNSDSANRKQLREPSLDLVASGKRVKDGPRVGKLLLDVEPSVGIVRVFQVTVGIDDFVSLDGILNRNHFRFRRAAGSGGIRSRRMLRGDQGHHADVKNQENSQQNANLPA